MEEQMKPAVSPLPADFLSYAHFERCLRTLNMQSTPGIPYCREEPSIGKWLKFDGVKYDDYRLQRLWYDTRLVLEGRYEHYMKAFVKLEPHKLDKIRNRRWRVIICFSLPVQMAWKMLFDHLNRTLIDKAFDLPVQHGFQLVHGSWKAYYHQWKSRGYNSGTDVSAWDWSVNGWMLDATLEIRKRLTRAAPDQMEIWTGIARRLFTDAFHPGCKIVLPSGRVYRQDFYGLQKSGSPNTIADNSLMRCFVAIIAGMRQGRSIILGRYVGDDALERHDNNPDYIASLKSIYAELGIVLKTVDFGMEFVGHRFGENGPQPLYLSKHLWNLYHTSLDILPDYLDSMLRLYTHSPHYGLWERIADKLGVSHHTREYYEAWYDREWIDIW
nr:RNA-dependent RNA polymerase [Solemoviridae sp.]